MLILQIVSANVDPIVRQSVGKLSLPHKKTKLDTTDAKNFPDMKKTAKV